MYSPGSSAYGCKNRKTKKYCWEKVNDREDNGVKKIDLYQVTPRVVYGLLVFFLTLYSATFFQPKMTSLL